jgi:hypothetical protein
VCVVHVLVISISTLEYEWLDVRCCSLQLQTRSSRFMFRTLERLRCPQTRYPCHTARGPYIPRYGSTCSTFSEHTRTFTDHSIIRIHKTFHEHDKHASHLTQEPRSAPAPSTYPFLYSARPYRLGFCHLHSHFQHQHGPVEGDHRILNASRQSYCWLNGL